MAFVINRDIRISQPSLQKISWSQCAVGTSKPLFASFPLPLSHQGHFNTLKTAS
jgi:hypothetical protein